MEEMRHWMSAPTNYLNEVNEQYRTHIAAEHAYRPALKTLLDAMGNGINAVNDPKRTEIGAPDYQVLLHNIPIGIVEAKDIGVSLDKTEKTEQMARYQKVGNVILTDYLEFRWYVNGVLRETIRVGEVKGKGVNALPERFAALETMLKSFMLEKSATIASAKELAGRMAGMAHLVKELIANDLQSAEPSAQLKSQMAAFQKTLLPEMDIAEFADMYAQTIAYGLFAARVNYSGNNFTRYDAARYIPVTNPFLRRLFHDISFDTGDRVNWLVDRLADLLAHTDTDAVLQDFGKATRQEDPVVHFYETFLREYDPQIREQRGVYYTPEPVVSYIVRSVDHILREKFNRREGLADKDTLVLDPATGTGTFLYFVIQHIYESMKGSRGIWKTYVRDHLLPRLFGFELLMAPYTVAHMKLSLQLKELGYDFPDNKRLGIYMTNTLEENVVKPPLPMAEFISEEANAAVDVKKNQPIMVILGNPPYSNFGQHNRGDWITNLMKGWKPEDETKWNPDDYMKFIRFGQWRIDKTGSGVLAFIVNHSFLQGITHRQMRESLMQTFTDIYILDLHGNNFLGEKAPDGQANDNVFDIRQGVAVVIFVKEANKIGMGKVHHAELWGQRQTKYNWLLNHDISNTDWSTLKNIERETCLGKFYFYAPRGFDNIESYCEGWSISDIFIEQSSGIQTKRDKVAIADSQKELMKTLEYFANNSVESIREKYELPEDGRDWRIDWASQHAKAVLGYKNGITKLLYRLFDEKWTIIEKRSKGIVAYPRYDTMRHMLNENLAMVTTRQLSLSTFQHIFATNRVIDGNTISLQSREYNYIFPLYLYPEKRAGELFDVVDDGSAWAVSHKGRRPNLNPAFVREMEGKLGLRFVAEADVPLHVPTDETGNIVGTSNGMSTNQPTPNPTAADNTGVFYPEDVFHYAYAVFHSPTYRERYAEFLKIDFPRLPLTSDVSLFRALCEKGAALVQWHLLTHPDVNKGEVNFDIEGNGLVATGYPRFDLSPADGKNAVPTAHDSVEVGRVWINGTQYFGNVPQQVWDFHIGGYQVLEKWLKDRKGRELSYEDVRHYQRVVKALQETMRLMDEIDELVSFPMV